MYFVNFTQKECIHADTFFGFFFAHQILNFEKEQIARSKREVFADESRS